MLPRGNSIRAVKRVKFTELNNCEDIGVAALWTARDRLRFPLAGVQGRRGEARQARGGGFASCPGPPDSSQAAARRRPPSPRPQGSPGQLCPTTPRAKDSAPVSLSFPIWNMRENIRAFHRIVVRFPKGLTECGPRPPRMPASVSVSLAACAGEGGLAAGGPG